MVRSWYYASCNHSNRHIHAVKKICRKFSFLHNAVENSIILLPWNCGWFLCAHGCSESLSEKIRKFTTVEEFERKLSLREISKKSCCATSTISFAILGGIPKLADHFSCSKQLIVWELSLKHCLCKLLRDLNDLWRSCLLSNRIDFFKAEMFSCLKA